MDASTDCDCDCACSLWEDFEAIRLEKKDFEASLECCLGDVLPGEEGKSDRVPILGEAEPFSDRICMFVFADRPWRAGDKGGEIGD